MTVTTCTPLPASALSTTASVPVSVLPSPVRISAIAPPCSTMPPIIWTSKWRMPMRRRETSRTTANVSSQQVVERLAVAGALAQAVGLRAQLLVVQQLELRLPRVDGVDALRVALELLGLAHPQGAIEDRHTTEDRGWSWPSRAALRRPGGCPAPPGRSPAAGGGDWAAGALLAAPAALVAVALDLARELVGDQVDRVLDVARGLRRAQRHALEVQGRLGHEALGVGGVASRPRARPRARPAR